MNVELLRQGDQQEWLRSGVDLWTMAITAARRFLYGREYSNADQKDVAQQVLIELSQNGIGNCYTEDDVSRWIWRRSFWRARDFRRKRRREREIFREQPEQNPEEDGRDAEPPQGVVPPVEQSPEALIREIVALSHLSPFEEAVFRKIMVNGMKHREFAAEYGLPLGTVGNLVNRVRAKIIAALGQGGDRFW